VVERYARYRAPSESGQKLAVPPWDEMSDLLAANLQWRAHADLELSGRSLTEVAATARRELIARARRYVASYASDFTGAAKELPEPLILTGHQPGFEHPGVWLKNFAAHELAEAHGGAAVHLVVDADVCRTSAIFVPAGGVDAPRLEPVAFDESTAPTPWEERAVLDGETWRSFPERVRAAAGPLAPTPMLEQWWPTVMARGAASGRLGAGLAQARHLTEIAWGRRNLELPQSELCQTWAFRWFVVHLLNDLPRFAAAYNDSLAAYRRERHLRNHAHPVPDLAADGPWLETPMWLWKADDPQRRPVFARRHGEKLLVSDRHGFERALPAGVSGGLDDAVGELTRWEADGFKLRSRALITTMFSRLVLADLFIHGIGGAKYDEATDAICQRFFGLTPPAFATVSGTLHLPIDHPPGDADAVRRLQGRLRELEFHPERFLNNDPHASGGFSGVAAVIADKSAWIAEAKTPANAAERHGAIAAANRALQPLVAAARQRTELELASQTRRAQANRILDSREFAFCLYPKRLLEQFLLDFPGHVR
jgi:hypothetical protein